MKKYITLNNCIKCGAVLFGLIAFFLMFADQLVGNITGVTIAFNDVFFGKNVNAPIGFVGYLFILIGALGICGVIFAPVKGLTRKLVDAAPALFLLLGAIFVFVTASVYNGNTGLGANPYNLTAAPVLAGIFAILAALAQCVTIFLPDRKLLK